MRVLFLAASAIFLSPAANAQEGRLLAMPYVGTQFFTGEIRPLEETFFPDPGPGLRLGGLVGFRALSDLSLNAELSIDWLNLDPVYGDGTTGLRASLSLAPLYRTPIGEPFEVVVGPKLGVWRQEFRNSNSAYNAGESGYVWGLNIAGFVRWGPRLVGALFSFEKAVRTEHCYENGLCFPMSGTTPEGILTFNVAALF